MSQNNSLYPLPDGFRCSGVIAGIKEDASRKDLGLIVTDRPALLGAVYTQNRFPSAHVRYCRELTPSDAFRALIVNSGNANAATGKKGEEANRAMVDLLAGELELAPESVFTSSTGIIGRPFPIDIVASAMKPLVSQLEPDCSAVAEAILTTDTRLKRATETVNIQGNDYRVTGFAKGSGMIHPHMATMLAYILTDAPLPFSDIQAITQRICDSSFNCISVDGDTSTNDSFYLIGSHRVERLTDEELGMVESAVRSVAISLAKQIAADGEGAEHLIEVVVKSGPDEAVTREVLHAILNSNLVKTAVHGKDPNWGRLLMAAGNGLARSGVDAANPISIIIQDTPVLVRGEPAAFDESDLSEKMGAEQVTIIVDLHGGSHVLTGWGCDLTNEYIHINADYTT